MPNKPDTTAGLLTLMIFVIGIVSALTPEGQESISSCLVPILLTFCVISLTLAILHRKWLVKIGGGIIFLVSAMMLIPRIF